jgi:hypothetical protein
MVIVKANAESEAGKLPSEQLLAAMDHFNQELVQAGIWRAGEGLHPSSKGARIRLAPGQGPRVIDGPFTETKELVAGYTIIQVKSREEAMEWVRRFPNPHLTEGEIEVRQIYDLDDFGDSPAIERFREMERAGQK